MRLLCHGLKESEAQINMIKVVTDRNERLVISFVLIQISFTSCNFAGHSSPCLNKTYCIIFNKLILMSLKAHKDHAAHRNIQEPHDFY